ncbi:MAG: tRNA1(Val) (adenine(37)-N6)-methyltransferase [Campylobacteraceae bacterium]
MILYQYEKGYRYNSDSMFLYDFITSFHPKGEVLDVGCGCGILGLLIKRDFPSINLTSIDIQEEHILLAQKNAEINELHVKTILADFTKANFDKQFDLIISNPPFYLQNTKQSEDERLKISRYENYLPFSKLFSQSYKLLNSGGSLIFCYDVNQIDKLMYELHNFKLKVSDICFVHPRADKESNIALIRAKKNSKSSTKIHSPLFVFEGKEYTKRVRDIFTKASTKSVTCN